MTVITAFQTPVIGSLSPDPVDRTNELLANLTDIVVLTLSRSGLSTPTEFSKPEPFVPSPSASVINLLWSLSLVIAVSILSGKMAKIETFLEILTAMLALFGRLWISSLVQEVRKASMVTKISLPGEEK